MTRSIRSFALVISLLGGYAALYAHKADLKPAGEVISVSVPVPNCPPNDPDACGIK